MINIFINKHGDMKIKSIQKLSKDDLVVLSCSILDNCITKDNVYLVERLIEDHKGLKDGKANK